MLGRFIVILQLLLDVFMDTQHIVEFTPLGGGHFMSQLEVDSGSASPHFFREWAAVFNKVSHRVHT